jgi:ADP-ribose pyrophosphatase
LGQAFSTGQRARKIRTGKNQGREKSGRGEMAKKEKAQKGAERKSKGATKKKSAKNSGKARRATVVERARVISSEVVYTGPLFRVHHDSIIEPGGRRNEREIIRHGGSAVILALDTSRSKKNPLVVMERQYRHAANQYLWELPAGKIDAGEEPLAGAQRELKEETGYRAKKWRPLVEYYPSPGFLGETMKVFLAEGLQAGEAQPEEDEAIELRLVKLSQVLKMIENGVIQDGKTLTSVLLYARLKGAKGKKR